MPDKARAHPRDARRVGGSMMAVRAEALNPCMHNVTALYGIIKGGVIESAAARVGGEASERMRGSIGCYERDIVAE
eukprot:364611-Chlamydomonas_euryale.AAC.5